MLTTFPGPTCSISARGGDGGRARRQGPGRPGALTSPHALVQHTLSGLSASAGPGPPSRGESIERIVANDPRHHRVGGLATHSGSPWCNRPSSSGDRLRPQGGGTGAGRGPRPRRRCAGSRSGRGDGTTTSRSCGASCSPSSATPSAVPDATRTTTACSERTSARGAHRARTTWSSTPAMSNYRGTLPSVVGRVDTEHVGVLDRRCAASATTTARPGAPVGDAAGRLTDSDDPRRVEIACEARALARSSAGAAVLVEHPRAHRQVALNVPELLDERDEQTPEAMKLADAAADPVRRFFASSRPAGAALELADIAGNARAWTSVGRRGPLRDRRCAGSPPSQRRRRSTRPATSRHGAATAKTWPSARKPVSPTPCSGSRQC